MHPGDRATDKGQKELSRRRLSRVSSPGSKFCSISSGAALKWVRNWRSAKRSASGIRQVYPPRATLLGSQDGQRLEQAAQGSAKESQGAPARHLDGRNQEGCRERLRLLPGSLRAEVRQGRGLPGQGPRRPADVLRLPRRALEACTHDQPHREVATVRLRTYRTKGCRRARRDGHGLQTMPVRSEKMEKTRWIEPCQIRRRRMMVARLGQP